MATILAGPILRRIEPGYVTVWVAFKDAMMAVKVEIFADTDLKMVVASATTHTRSFGKNLHIAVIKVEVKGFLAGTKYRYDLKYGDITADESLSDTGLLKKTTPCPLGYDQDALPSFITPAGLSEKLVLAHGSCRKIHGKGQDAFGALDDLIAQNEKTETPKPERPQLLFLTGDQIYADDVPAVALYSIMDLAKTLMPDENIILLKDGKIVEGTETGKNYPPMFRQKAIEESAGMSSSAADCHLITFGEFCAAYLHFWSPDVWSEDIKKILEKPATLEKLDSFPGIVSFEDVVHKNRLLIESIPKIDEAEKDKKPSAEQEYIKKWREEKESTFMKDVIATAEFWATLPKARRVLANVPSLMIFDDHEVTDDWNITQGWKDKVYKSPMGKTIIRNALMAYAIFQDWGNVPDDYSDQSPKAQLLGLIANYADVVKSDKKISTLNRIDELLGLTEPKAEPEIEWSYQSSIGSSAKAYILDSRNHRIYDRKQSPPGLLSPKALNQQLQFPTPTPNELLIVVAPCPVIGLSMYEELLLPAVTAIMGLNKKGMELGQYKFDNEAWYQHTPTFERLIERIAQYKKAVILSGDIHYGCSAVLDYWKGLQHSRMVQLVSSPFKNEWLANNRALESGLAQGFFTGFGEHIEKFGWKTPPSKVEGNLPFRSRVRLQNTPAVISKPEVVPAVLEKPETEIHPDVKIDPAHDWSYRFTSISDVRKDEEFKDFDIKKFDHMKKVLERHQRWFKEGKTRRVVYSAHFSTIQFGGNFSSLKHTFYTNKGKDNTPIKDLILAIHDIPLEIINPISPILTKK
jgi:hypothetical protein